MRQMPEYQIARVQESDFRKELVQLELNSEGFLIGFSTVRNKGINTSESPELTDRGSTDSRQKAPDLKLKPADQNQLNNRKSTERTTQEVRRRAEPPDTPAIYSLPGCKKKVSILGLFCGRLARLDTFAISISEPSV